MGLFRKRRGDLLKNTINLNKVIEKFDHNAEDLPNALGVLHTDTLAEAVYDWMHEHNDHSRVFEIILKHETLNDNEKLFCIMIMGQILSLTGIMSRVKGLS